MNDQKNAFTLTTTPRKNFLLIGVLILGLALWGSGLVTVASALLRGQIKEVGFFVVFFLLSWLASWLLGEGSPFMACSGCSAAPRRWSRPPGS